jgi:biotin carboxyl carrier protein
MRINITRDGRTTSVEVASGIDAVTVGNERYPVTVVRATATSVELEIAGERAIVENWPEHFPEPPGPVDVNGERWKVGVERSSGTEEQPVAARHAPATTPTAGTPPAKAPPRAGSPIVPPMPGKVIELRVKEGDRVRKGDVLLVLEAMKMRNEVTSPVDGVVRGLVVAAGANARAKEPMLFVAVEGASP